LNRDFEDPQAVSPGPVSSQRCSNSLAKDLEMAYNNSFENLMGMIVEIKQMLSSLVKKLMAKIQSEC
jgi:hypothetical protein